ncbi:MAG: PAS domain S-box protein, partial [Candidatus Omnitrophica bacterium]|nr:PAS domain S-box protein [Candidatus Omnitrophota bacterium]
MTTQKKNKRIPRKLKPKRSPPASHLFDVTGYGVCRYLVNEERILFANQGVIDIMGLRCKPEELTGKCFDDIFALIDKPDTIKKALASGDEIIHTECHFKTLTGEEKWILLDARIKRNPATTKKTAEAIIRDITYLKLSEHNLAALNQKLKMLVECSQTIVHATDEQELLKKICDIIITEGEYRFTWIGLARDNEQKTVEPIVWAGYEKDYLQTIRVSWGINEYGQGPVGTAIRTGKSNINRNILVDPQYGLWREEALRRGYNASISLPLVIDNLCIGALNIYASCAEAFDPDEALLLSELASDISYGITTLRARNEKNKTEAALAESEERFRKAFETTGIGMALVALDGRWLKVNRTLCEIVGYSTEELLSMSFQDITHQDDLGADVSYVQRMLRREILYYHQEKRYVHKQSHIIWVLLSASLVTSPTGEPLYFVFQIQNITDRKKAEEALRAGERFLSSCFTSIQDGINILDKEMNILRVNPVMETWYAHAMPLVGKKCYDAYHSRTRQCEICPSAQTIVSEKAAYEEVPKRGPGGEIVGWLDLYSFPLIDQETGTMKGVIEYVRDITERKRAEEALKESKERFEQIANNAYEWVWEIDQNGLYVYSNPAVEKILGYRPEELVGEKFFYDFFTPQSTEQLAMDARAAFQKQQPIKNFINPCVTKTGAIVVLESNGTPILDKQGAFCGYRGINVDVTQRKALEELKDNFINTISHELKT